MKIFHVSKVAVCTTVRFADSGRIFCPRFARAPADVASTTSLVASTNLEQNLSAIIPQTGEISGLVEVAAQIGKSVSASERASAKLTSEGRPCRVGPVKATSGKRWNDQTRSGGTLRGDRVGDWRRVRRTGGDLDPLDKSANDGLEALQRALIRALDRKRRREQYAVFSEDDRVVFVGPDAPRL